MFVWIPRYSYKITNGYHENLEDVGTIDIEFLSGTANSQNDYIVHPSFKFGEAIYETSSKSALKNGWYSSETPFINSSYPFFIRGGKLGSGNIYNFSAFSGEKGYYGFRAMEKTWLR